MGRLAGKFVFSGVRNWFFGFLIILLGCAEDEPGAGHYEVPAEEADGLATGHAQDVDLDIAPLSELIENNLNGTYENVHSILIARNGQLVFERYFRGKPIYGPTTDWESGKKHNLHSVTKSFNSALIGIAIDQFGLSIDDPVRNFFPELADSNWEGKKGEITVEDLLTMSSGLKWDEWSFSYDDSRNDHAQMYESTNWVHFVLTQPLDATPGTKFIYNSGLSITLGEIVSRVSEMELGSFAKKHLFDPMGITKVDWHRSNNRIYQTGGGLSLRPRDMLKFGMLFLQEGVWEGQQIISSEWVENSTRQQGPNPQYAYQWWLTSYRVGSRVYDAFLAAGRGGQYIVVLKRLNMVVVFTAGNDNGLSTSQPRDMMINYILPSLQR